MSLTTLRNLLRPAYRALRSNYSIEKLHQTSVALINSLHADVKTLITLSTGMRQDLDWIKRNESAKEALLDPIDKYVVQKHRITTEGHFHSHYIEWRTRRISKVLEFLGIDLSGKRILELGGGHGDIGAFFAALGAEVVSAEGRPFNSHLANLKHRHVQNFKSIVRDIEQDFSDLGKFDIILSFGSLEVIDNIDNYLKCCCQMSNLVIFETYVLDSEDPFATVTGGDFDSKTVSMDHTLSGRITVPSPFYIERVFREHGFTIERYFHSDINSGPHCYDWEAGDPREDITKRRFWRFKKS